MPAIEVEAVVKAFVSPDGERNTILDVPRFSLGDGQQMALQGASGSGKTTFLHVLAGILRPDRGTIRIAGEQMAPAGESARDLLRGRCVGYIFQTFNLLQGYTAIENVELAMSLGRGRSHTLAAALLERVGLRDRMQYRPRQLSVGQQQRVAVARALANAPRVVLADEPTGNLDERHARQAIELIRSVCSECGAALLLVSHDPAVLGQFEHVEHLGRINRLELVP
jgi:putative ABC transport system ATP-binding protein